jgi:hypothetical protein
MFRSLPAFVSWLFHPLLMPAYAVTLLFSLRSYLSISIPAPVRLFIYGTVIVTTLALPALFVLLLYQRGRVKSLEMAEANERRLSYLVTAVFYFIAFWLMKTWQVPRIFPVLFAGACFIIVAAFLINLRWKISIHMMGLGGLLGLVWCLPGLLYVNVLPYFTALVLIAGLTGTARLLRQAHTPAQVYAGLLAGFAIQAAAMATLT